VPEERVVLVGARDLDPAEEEVLRTSDISLVRGGAGASVLGGLAWPLDQVARECPRVYVHLDCDVLDTSVGRANRFACPGGLSADELAAAMRMVRERFVVAGMGVSAYDPAFDTDGGILRAVTGAVRALLA
jgi:arginase